MSTEPSPNDIDEARVQIDRLDEQLLQVLAERMRVVSQVGQIKGRTDRSQVRDTERERRLQARWRSKAEEAGLSSHFASRVLREVLTYSRRSQELHLGQSETVATQPLRVAYQGETHSYSDMAATQLFSTRTSREVIRIGYHTFSAVVESVLEGRVDYAWLPVENSIAGSIGAVGSLVASSDLFVVDEESWDVQHVLAIHPEHANDPVLRIRSHPVALNQCARLFGKAPETIAEPWPDTAGAAASIADGSHPGVASISSEEAALAHGLHILSRDVADEARNVTRFWLLSRTQESAPAGVQCKTSLLLTLDHRQGALAKILTLFASRSINLTRIESRPDPKTPWRYRFFIDVQGHLELEPLSSALEELRGYCSWLRILGSYPLRTDEPNAVEERPALVSEVAELPLKSEHRGTVPQGTSEAVVRTRAIQIGNHVVGGEAFTLILGPSAVESRAQIQAAAEMVGRAGANLLRGGAFKPRTSPHSFQGLGVEGLELLAEAGRAVNLPVVTELLRIEDLEAVLSSADVVLVGARNMQNYSLLRALGAVDCPVLLKRGLSATIDELLSAAECITAGGNQRVILCERGIRTFETSMRSTLDLGAVAVLKARTELPVIVDPSHAAGVRSLVLPLARAAAAIGADGLMVEAHPNPDAALCDKDQALTEADLQQLVTELRPILAARGRRLSE
jgi:3-deoxy-7-phosphoheptulonate synthase